MARDEAQVPAGTVRGRGKAVAGARMTVSLVGTITAVGPIHIARPGMAEGELLTMNVVRGEANARVHVLPGSTLKGLLRGAALQVCVDAARAGGGEPRMSLEGFYRQAAGGLNFTAEKRALGSDDAVRDGQPLLSLMGCASPKIRGRLIVQAGLGRVPQGAVEPTGTGLAQSTRQDALAGDRGYAGLVSTGEAALWERQQGAGGIVASASGARAELKDAEHKLRRARARQATDTADLEAAVAATRECVEAIKGDDEFAHAIMRLLPVIPAAPAGTEFDHVIQVVDAEPAEVGLLFAAMQQWGLLPRIGGNRSIGYGEIKASYAVSIQRGDGLPRMRRWEPAGALDIGRDGTRASIHDPEVAEAIAAWGAMEADILAKTRIFD